MTDADAPATRVAGPGDDARLFLLLSAVVATAMLGGGPLSLLAESTAGSEPTLIARMGSRRTVSALYGAFAILPALLAFVVVGLPSFARAVFAVVRGRARAASLWPLALQSLLWALFVGAAGVGWLGLAALIGAAVAGWWLAADTATDVGRRWTPRVLALGAVGLCALAVYEYRWLSAGVESLYVAPTCVVTAGFAFALGLPMATRATVARGAGLAPCALLYAAAAAWFVPPLAADGLAPLVTGRAELWATVAAAALVVAAAVLWPRSD